MKINKILNIAITISISLWLGLAPVNSQTTTNLLPMHTGKSYILDFPVKVTRVVGGDPSAIELNLFKKKEIEGEIPGYQLLVAPIAEKNTNIIVWTDLGLYVFDVVIDNTSPYTAETIVIVPEDTKKFVIPLVESAHNTIQTITPEEGDQQELLNEEGDSINKVEYQVKEEVIDQPPEVKLETKETTESINDIIIDQPPEPELVPPVEIKKKKETKAKNIKKENKNNKKNVEKKETKPVKKEEVIEIDLKPQASKKLNVENSLDETAETKYSGKLTKSSKDLKLTVTAVDLVDKSFVIHLTLRNSSDKVKYLLWDLTRVTDSRGERFLVRNKDLPPGIVYPGKDLKGSVLAIPKTKTLDLSKIKTLHLALLNTEGEIILTTEIPLESK